MKAFRSMDGVVLACLLCLAALGLLTLYAALHHGDLGLWRRQAVFWLLGMAAFGAVCFIPLRLMALGSLPLYLVSLLLLALVPIAGEVQMGARRWLNLGLVHLQPSEMMKWALVFVLAFWFSSREARRPVDLGVALLMTLLPAGLILIQPDLGTTMVLLLAAGAMLIAAGLPWKWFAAGLATAVAALPVLWHYMHDYQRQRVLTFLDPESDPLGAGYHVIQSKIAIGSGGLFGKGYLQGTQARLHFLPEQHTDFIFAVLAEEGGLIAVSLLLLLYAILIGRILVIAGRARTRFGSLLCIGVASMFMIYVGINVGMVSGLLPVVGVPLPFISYGGSALVTMLAALGLVMRVAIESRGTIPWQRPGSPLA
ncbi:MAG: rod shape-determining protein RodA [Mariprofundaceae bacterium]